MRPGVKLSSVKAGKKEDALPGRGERTDGDVSLGQKRGREPLK